MDIEAQLRKLIHDAVKSAGIKTDMHAGEIILDAPKAKEHGDVSTNAAMKLARPARMSPMETAEAIVGRIQKELVRTPLRGKIAKISVKEPGFINFFFTKSALYDILEEIQSEGPRYGRCSLGAGKKIQIEFVSANPTGPLSVAHGRQAAIGDSLANILAFAGWKVTREYFINDEGRQMDLLAESIRQRYLELLGERAEFPEDGYKGGYIRDIARTIVDKYKKKYVKPSKKASQFFRDYGCKYIMAVIKNELEDFGVRFDVFASQAKVSTAGGINKALKYLEKDGFLYKKDGALWFKSTAFGDDKDRVVTKSDGSFTYLAPDIAYHQDKFRRGFKKVINIWGPDHHGYIPRLRAAVQALGHAKDSLHVLIVQLATLYRGKEQVPMSTRSGEFVTLREVMEDVGVDAARFFFVARKASSHLDFDIELAKKQSQDNPVYYVQYAHARICNIMEFAKNQAPENAAGAGQADLKLLKEPQELGLIKALSQFPDVIIFCAESLEPCGLVSYLMGLADAFHSFYDKHRVVTDDLALTRSRLVLVDCAKTVFATGLRLLGVSTPTKM